MPNQKPTSRIEWQNATRQKLQASGIINRLIDHALSDEDIMSVSQVNAARVILNKTLPDLKAVDIQGELDHRHDITENAAEALEKVKQAIGLTD